MREETNDIKENFLEQNEAVRRGILFERNQWKQKIKELKKEIERLKSEKLDDVAKSFDWVNNLREKDLIPLVKENIKLKSQLNNQKEKIKERIENFNPKPLTEAFLIEKHIKEWKLINNGLLEYSDWIVKKILKSLLDEKDVETL